jgi:hypothetical protein
MSLCAAHRSSPLQVQLMVGAFAIGHTRRCVADNVVPPLGSRLLRLRTPDNPNHWPESAWLSRTELWTLSTTVRDEPQDYFCLWSRYCGIAKFVRRTISIQSWRGLRLVKSVNSKGILLPPSPNRFDFHWPSSMISTTEMINWPIILVSSLRHANTCQYCQAMQGNCFSFLHLHSYQSRHHLHSNLW